MTRALYQSIFFLKIYILISEYIVRFLTPRYFNPTPSPSQKFIKFKSTNSSFLVFLHLTPRGLKLHHYHYHYYHHRSFFLDCFSSSFFFFLIGFSPPSSPFLLFFFFLFLLLFFFFFFLFYLRVTSCKEKKEKKSKEKKKKKRKKERRAESSRCFHFKSSLFSLLPSAKWQSCICGWAWERWYLARGVLKTVRGNEY